MLRNASAAPIVRRLLASREAGVFLALVVLILDEPTHGIDVGAKADVYELIRQLARSAIAIALISSELPEVIAMADRAVVMHEGRVTAILERDQIDEHRIMAHATGTVGTTGPRP